MARTRVLRNLVSGTQKDLTQVATTALLSMVQPSTRLAFLRTREVYMGGCYQPNIGIKPHTVWFCFHPNEGLLSPRTHSSFCHYGHLLSSSPPQIAPAYPTLRFDHGMHVHLESSEANTTFLCSTKNRRTKRLAKQIACLSASLIGRVRNLLKYLFLIPLAKILDMQKYKMQSFLVSSDVQSNRQYVLHTGLLYHTV